MRKEKVLTGSIRTVKGCSYVWHANVTAFELCLKEEVFIEGEDSMNKALGTRVEISIPSEAYD